MNHAGYTVCAGCQTRHLRVYCLNPESTHGSNGPLICLLFWVCRYVISVVVHCRVPEEAPQEIADLVLRCTGQAEERPSAAEAADIIRLHVISAAKSGDSSTPRRTSSSAARSGSAGGVEPKRASSGA